MTRTISKIIVLSLVAWSCGESEPDGEAAPAVESVAPSSAPEASAGSGGFTRESFVLCPALEEHREELAAIVGFEQDPERGLAGVGSECIIRGEDGGFARVTLLPAIVPSIAMHAESFDAEASPAPELGDDAIFVDGQLQPHVVFSLGSLLIDVDAENLQTPDRETMIELATRVREILLEANS